MHSSVPARVEAAEIDRWPAGADVVRAADDVRVERCAIGIPAIRLAVGSAVPTGLGGVSAGGLPRDAMAAMPDVV